MAEATKRRALGRGRSAERRAAWLLRLKGYAILACNWRPAKNAGLGEIDIVARRGGVLVFVEVKARAAEDAAIRAVDPLQQGRIARAAAHFVKQRPLYRAFGVRYDAMVLEAGRFWPKHLIDVWRG